MDPKTEAGKAMDRAEERYKANDFQGAMRLAREAEALFPSLPGVKQALAAYGVHAVATKTTKGGRTDWHAILGADPLFDIESIRKQFKKMCIMTHPDKNGSAAADGAFKFVKDAWEAVSKDHDRRRKDGSQDPPPTKPDDSEDVGSRDHHSDHGREGRATNNTDPPPTKPDNSEDAGSQDHQNDHGSEGRATDTTEPPPSEPSSGDGRGGQDHPNDETDPRSTKQDDQGRDEKKAEPQSADRGARTYRVACPKCGKQCKRRMIAGHGFIRCKHACLGGEQAQNYDYYHVVIQRESIVYCPVNFRGRNCTNTGYSSNKQTKTGIGQGNWTNNWKNKHQSREKYNGTQRRFR